MTNNASYIAASNAARKFIYALENIPDDLRALEQLGRDLHEATRVFASAEPRRAALDGAPSTHREIARLLGLSGDDASHFVDAALQLADPRPRIIIAGRGPGIESAYLKSVVDEISRPSVSVTFSVPLQDARALAPLLGHEVTLAVTEKVR